MKVLIAEDHLDSQRLLETMLRRWGHEVVSTSDGNQAWEALQQQNAPSLLILDIMIPGIDGIEICRRLREKRGASPLYIILLTAKAGREQIVEGLQAGADDYITKPFNVDELRARISVGARVVELQSNLTARVAELENALQSVRQLQGLLPICSYCKSIRDDKNYWQKVETYLAEHSDAQFSHSICPACYDKFVKPELEELAEKKKRKAKQP